MLRSSSIERCLSVLCSLVTLSLFDLILKVRNPFHIFSSFLLRSILLPSISGLVKVVPFLKIF